LPPPGDFCIKIQLPSCSPQAVESLYLLPVMMVSSGGLHLLWRNMSVLCSPLYQNHEHHKESPQTVHVTNISTLSYESLRYTSVEDIENCSLSDVMSCSMEKKKHLAIFRMNVLPQPSGWRSVE
jgi:hypothetical protein